MTERAPHHPTPEAVDADPPTDDAAHSRHLAMGNKLGHYSIA